VFPTDWEKYYIQKLCVNSVKIMRHKCRYGGSNNALIGSIHTRKTTSIYTKYVFVVFIVRREQPKLGDYVVGMGGSRTRKD